MSFRHLKVNDKVKRDLCGVIMYMIVIEVRENTIVCGALLSEGVLHGGWQFDRDSGDEEDHELGWGRAFGKTGSRLIKE